MGCWRIELIALVHWSQFFARRICGPSIAHLQLNLYNKQYFEVFVYSMHHPASESKRQHRSHPLIMSCPGAAVSIYRRGVRPVDRVDGDLDNRV